MFCSLLHKHEGTSKCCTQCNTVAQQYFLRRHSTSCSRNHVLEQVAASRSRKSRSSRLRRQAHGQLQTAVSELPPLPQRAIGTTSTSYDGSFDVETLYTESTSSSRLSMNSGLNVLQTERLEQDVSSCDPIVPDAPVGKNKSAHGRVSKLQDGLQAPKQSPARKHSKRKAPGVDDGGPAEEVPPELITSALRSCKHWSDVRKLWELHGCQLNCIHVSASIWKLAVVAPPSYQRQLTRPRRRALDLFLLSVIERAHALAHTADFRTAANICMGLAKVVAINRFPRPTPKSAPLAESATAVVTRLLASWQSHLCEEAEIESQPSASSNGAARHESAGSASGLKSRSNSKAGVKPADYAQMLWAAAKFGVVPSQEWTRAFCRCSRPRLAHFKREELVITLYSLAVLQLRPELDWCQACCQALSPRLHEMSLQELADVTWSLARMQLPVPDTTSHAIIQATSFSIGRLHSQDPKSAAAAVSLLIWALGKLHSRTISQLRPQSLVFWPDGLDAEWVEVSGSNLSRSGSDAAAGGVPTGNSTVRGSNETINSMKYTNIITKDTTSSSDSSSGSGKTVIVSNNNATSSNSEANSGGNITSGSSHSSSGSTVAGFSEGTLGGIGNGWPSSDNSTLSSGRVVNSPNSMSSSSSIQTGGGPGSGSNPAGDPSNSSSGIGHDVNGPGVVRSSVGVESVLRPSKTWQTPSGRSASLGSVPSTSSLGNSSFSSSNVWSALSSSVDAAAVSSSWDAASPSPSYDGLSASFSAAVQASSPSSSAGEATFPPSSVDAVLPPLSSADAVPSFSRSNTASNSGPTSPSTSAPTPSSSLHPPHPGISAAAALSAAAQILSSTSSSATGAGSWQTDLAPHEHWNGADSSNGTGREYRTGSSGMSSQQFAPQARSGISRGTAGLEGLPYGQELNRAPPGEIVGDDTQPTGVNQMPRLCRPSFRNTDVGASSQVGDLNSPNHRSLDRRLQSRTSGMSTHKSAASGSEGSETGMDTTSNNQLVGVSRPDDEPQSRQLNSGRPSFSGGGMGTASRSGDDSLLSDRLNYGAGGALGSPGDIRSARTRSTHQSDAQGLVRPLLPGFGAHPRPALSWHVPRMEGRMGGNGIFNTDSSWDDGYERIVPAAMGSQWKPDGKWMSNVCRCSLPLLHHCQARELAAALHGWANLAMCPDPLWLDQFFSVTPTHFRNLSVKEIAIICWALGRLEERPPVTWMRRFLIEMANRPRKEYHKAEMMQIIWCMQQLRVASVHMFSPDAILRLKTNRHVFHAFLQRIAYMRSARARQIASDQGS